MDGAQAICEACPDGPHVCHRCARSCCSRHFTLSAALVEGAPMIVTAAFTGGRGAVLPPGPAVAEFVAYLTGGLAERYGVPTQLGGQPMRGGAAEAYRAAWIAPTHVCVFCRVSSAQEAALVWSQQYEANAAMEHELRERQEAAAALARAETEAREAGEREHTQRVHEVHVRRIAAVSRAEADLLAERDEIVTEARRVRRVGRQAAHDRRRLERGPFLSHMALRVASSAAAVQAVMVIAARVVLPRTAGWSMLELGVITALLSGLAWWLIDREVRRRVLDAGELEVLLPPTLAAVTGAIVAVGVVALFVALVLKGHAGMVVSFGLVAVADLIVGAAAAVPVLAAQARLDTAAHLETAAIDLLRARHDEVERALAQYRCGQPGCPHCNSPLR